MAGKTLPIEQFREALRSAAVLDVSTKQPETGLPAREIEILFSSEEQRDATLTLLRDTIRGRLPSFPRIEIQKTATPAEESMVYGISLKNKMAEWFLEQVELGKSTIPEPALFYAKVEQLTHETNEAYKEASRQAAEVLQQQKTVLSGSNADQEAGRILNGACAVFIDVGDPEEETTYYIVVKQEQALPLLQERLKAFVAELTETDALYVTITAPAIETLKLGDKTFPCISFFGESETLEILRDMLKKRVPVTISMGEDASKETEEGVARRIQHEFATRSAQNRKE